MAAVLLIVDVQNAFFRPAEGPPVHEAGAVLSRISALVERARAAGVPVIFIRHGEEGDPQFRPGSESWSLALAPRPDEPVVDKTTPDSFHATDLAGRLAGLGAQDLILAGCQSEFCIATTARAAAARGYRVTVASDAHSTWDDWRGRYTAPARIAEENAALAGTARLRPAAEIAFGE